VILWVAQGEISTGPAAVTDGLLVAFAPGVIAAGLVRRLRRDRTVTAQTLSGVLAIYLLAGMLFSFVYGVIGSVDADALFTGRTTSTVSDQLYFSFVTLSTVGYGDFTPAGDITRTVAIAEMLTGQIYLVTVVSLIVANLGRRAASGRQDQG
jgi:Ion channel